MKRKILINLFSNYDIKINISDKEKRKNIQDSEIVTMKIPKDLKKNSTLNLHVIDHNKINVKKKIILNIFSDYDIEIVDDKDASKNMLDYDNIEMQLSLAQAIFGTTINIIVE